MSSSDRPVTAEFFGSERTVTEYLIAEMLGVLLVPSHLHDSEPMPLTRAVCPGAQQRRLPAAGLRRDDTPSPPPRDKRGEKITPVDQPGGCPSHRQRPALVSTPDALASVS